MKKKKQVAKKKAKKPAPKKKVVSAVQEKENLYEIQLETSVKDGVYIYTSHAVGVGEKEAETMVADLKAIGMGGRQILIDGSPDGKVTLTWGSVERTADAEKVERAALQK